MPYLFINQFYWPDSAATSQLLTDLTDHVARQGHQVHVICADSEYAAGATSAAPRVAIHRCPTLPFGRSAFGRIASYASFLMMATLKGLRGPRPDVVITLTTPPALGLIGVFIGLIRGSRCIMWEMDVYPDIAIDLDVLKASAPLSRLLAWALNSARRRADGIIVLGEEMKDRLVAQGVPAGQIHVCENWADGGEIVPEPFPEGPLTIHYSGNLGLAHEVETVRGAMLHFRADPRFRFVFAGGGPHRGKLEAFCREHEVRNVEFKSYCGRTELSASLAEGHVGLVTQLPRTLGSVVPSKTYGIMAAGRPILYVGPKQGTPARIVEKYDCGWRVEPGDLSGMIDRLEWLAANPEAIDAAGATARAVFDRNFDRSTGMARIAAALGLEAFNSANLEAAPLLK